MPSKKIKFCLVFQLMLNGVLAQKNCSGENNSEYLCIPTEYLGTIRDAPKAFSEIDVYLNNIQVIKIDDKSQQISLSMEMEIYWCDQRIKWLSETVDSAKNILLGDQLWVPDLRIKNETTIYEYELKGSATRIYDLKKIPNSSTDGGVCLLQKSRFRATVFCEMLFGRFPFDNQVCNFEIENRENEISIGNVTLNYVERGVSGFAIELSKLKPMENPPRFGIIIKLDRISSVYLMKYYGVCMILVIAGSGSFLIDPKVVSGRNGILVTLLLVTSNFFSMAQRETSSARPTALHLYLVICMAFIIIAMLYYGLLLYMTRKSSQDKDKVKPIEGNDDENSGQIFKMDQIMLVVYVVSFVIFNIIYFISNCA